MTDLTEFLLARISDEENGIKPGTIQNGVFSGIMAHYGLDESDDDDQAEASEITDAVMEYLRPRVLAECETRKAIIAACIPNLTAGGGYDEEAILAKSTLLALALPYADHPAYNPEWRPA